jgi:hypothetical protein
MMPPDLSTRTKTGIDDDDACPLLRRTRCRGDPGGTAADDGDIVLRDW